LHLKFSLRRAGISKNVMPILAGEHYNPSCFSHVSNFHMFGNMSDVNCSIYISWSLVESTIALGAKNNKIFFFSQFLVEKYNKYFFGKQNHGLGSLQVSLGLLWKFWKPLNMLALWWWWWWDGRKVDVPKSGDDMIFIAFSLWSLGWRRRQSRFQSDSNCTSLGSSSSCLISLSLSLSHTHLQFFTIVVAPARRRTTLVKWFH
jgi:hypothetical protein